MSNTITHTTPPPTLHSGLHWIAYILFSVSFVRLLFFFFLVLSSIFFLWESFSWELPQRKFHFVHIIITNIIESWNVEIHQKQSSINIKIALCCCGDGGAGVSGWLWQPGLICRGLGWRWSGGACITRTYYDDEMSDKTPNTLLEKFLPPIRGVQPGDREGKRGGALTWLDRRLSGGTRLTKSNGRQSRCHA